MSVAFMSAGSVQTIAARPQFRCEPVGVVPPAWASDVQAHPDTPYTSTELDEPVKRPKLKLL